jgi:hypothetical protein
VSVWWWETDPDSAVYSVREEVFDFIAAQRGSWSVYAWATGSEGADVTAAMSQLATADLGGTLRNGGLGAGATTVSVLLDDIEAANNDEACDVAIDKIGAALGLNTTDRTRAGLAALSVSINRFLSLHTLVVHPVTYALAVSGGKASVVEGPHVAAPLITTGAGDHFNAGFCLGQLLGLDIPSSVLTGVSTSGFYVRTARSPSVIDLAGLMRNWPSK